MNRSSRSMVLAVFLAFAMALAQVSPAYAAALPAEINQQFTPLQIDAGGVSRLRISIYNPNAFPLSNVAFTNTFPTGLYFATPANETSSPSCGSPTITLSGTGTLADPAKLTFSGGAVPAQTTIPGECWLEVDVSSVTEGNLINRIPAGALTASGIDPGPPPVTYPIITNTSPASATISIIGVDPPSMSKGFNPNTIYVGETSQLTIRINNNDPDTNLTDVSFTDNLPAGVKLATPASPVMTGCGAGTLTAADDTTIVSLGGGTVTPAVDCIIRVNVTGVGGEFTNIIPAGPVNPNSLHTRQGVTNGSDARADLNIQPVVISKAFAPNAIDAGDTAVLTITLQNPTLADYTGAGITDTMPTGLTVLAAPVPATTCTGGIVTVATVVNPNDSVRLTGGTVPARVPPATLGTCTITATVRANFNGAGGLLTNRIEPGDFTANGGLVRNFNLVTTDITVTPALTGTKAFSNPPYAVIPLNGTATVRITLNNNSSTPFTDVDFTDTLPAGLVISGTPGPTQCGGAITFTPGSITLTNGTIAANSSCVINFDVTSVTPGTYSNSLDPGSVTACTAALGCVGNGSAITTGTDLTVVNAPVLPMEVGKNFSPANVLGSVTRVTITVTAPLDIAVSGISLIDTLPTDQATGLNPMTVSATPGFATTCPGGAVSTNPGRTQLILNGASLAAGASCTFSANVTAASGVYINTIPTGAISTTELRTNQLDTATATASLTSMTMRKAFYPDVVQADGKSTLTITLENTSPLPLKNLDLTDTLPGDTTNGVVIAGPATTTCEVLPGEPATITAVSGTQTIHLQNGTVPAWSGGINGICTITLDVQGKSSSPITSTDYPNTIPVTAVSATEGVGGPTLRPLSPATDTLTVRKLEMGIVKGFDPVLVYGGATSTMTVRLINPNSSPLTGITFTDNFASISSGIILANPPMFDTGTCGGTLSGLPGASSFTFSGGLLYPNQTCEMTLRVIMNENGNRTNEIPAYDPLNPAAGGVTTFNGVSNEDPTQASLTNLPGLSVVKVFNPNPVNINDAVQMTITVSNTSNVPVVGMVLIDEFPTVPLGLVVVDGPGAADDPFNDCTDTGAPATLTAIDGDDQIQLTGGSLQGKGSPLPNPHESCTIRIYVKSSNPGAFENVIPVGNVTGNPGPNPVTNLNPGSDILRVGSLYSLGNRVWLDTNNNGVIDASEVGVDDVVVQLYSADGSGNPTGPVRRTEITDQGGYYRFDDLEPGDYVVVIPASQFAAGGELAGYWSTGTSIDAANVLSDGTSNDPDNNTDSDENGETQTGGAFNGAVISDAVTLGPGASEPTNDTDRPLANPFGESPNDYSNRTVDFGFYRLSVGDLVFLDSNGSGTYGAGDSLIAGARVQLFASNGTTEINVGPDGVLGTSDDAPNGLITDATGEYLFDGLAAGDYVIKVTPPAAPGYSSTTDSADTTTPNSNVNNNDNGIGTGAGQVSSNPVTLTPGSSGAQNQNTITQATGGTHNPTMDFGFLLYSLGNRVWFDTNNDGDIDGTEVGVNGVFVTLYRDDGDGVYDAGDTYVGSDVTENGGYYRFDDLPAGDYVVVIPNDNFTTGGYASLAGYWSSGTLMDASGNLSDSTSNDVDIDVADSDENGITTFTSALITLVNPINYVSSQAITLGGAPPEPTGETDLSGEQGTVDDHANMTADFGFYRTAIGNLVFVNSISGGTDDGDYDVGLDTPLQNAVVTLFASDGATQVPTGSDGVLGTGTDNNTGITTPATGIYAFSGLPAGDYVVKVTPPAGYVSIVDTADITLPDDNADPDDNLDNNDNGIGNVAGPTSWNSGILTMSPSTETLSATITRTDATGTTTDTSVDFGFISPTFSLGNRVWYDTNNDGDMDAGETGINNIRLRLYQDNGATPGVYDATDTEVNVGPDGILGTADDASNGVVTNATGYYRFDGLPVGEYVVRLTPPANYWSSGTRRADASGVLTDTIGPDPDNDADTNLDENGITTFTTPANPEEAVVSYVSSAAVTLGGVPLEPVSENDPAAPFWQGTGDDHANMTLDFGFYRTNIGDLVFIDNNNDGSYNAGDAVLPGATVQLFTSDGSIQIGGDTTSDASGNYSFQNQPEGNYVLKVTPPVGYSSAIDTAGSANPNSNVNNPQDDNGIGTAAGIVVTSSGQLTVDAGWIGAQNQNIITAGNTTDNTVDFGFVPLRFSLGNYVWFDADNDSLYENDGAGPNPDEVGVNGVRVRLYRDNGTTAGVYDAGDTEVNVGPDGRLGNADDAAGGVFTNANGYYRFDNLLAGNYIVVIPADNFRNIGGADNVPGDPLKGYWSSGTTIANNGAVSDSTSPVANDPDNNVDSDENGVTTFATRTITRVASGAVTLGPGNNEPTTDNDPATNPEAGEQVNNQSNRTVDFGFYRTQAGNLVFYDTDTSGHNNAGDTPIANALVRLYAANNTTELITGADGIFGTQDDTWGPDGVVGGGDDNTGGIRTDPSGNYLFGGLPAGDYIVKVNTPAGLISTIDSNPQNDNDNPDTNVDDNDNGDGQNSGLVTSDTTNRLTTTPGSTGALGNNTVTLSNGTTANPTMDFGFIHAYSVGNRVWYDTNNDGVLDAGENGINGVRVQLFNSLGVEIITGADGRRGTADDGWGPNGVAGGGDDGAGGLFTSGGGYYRFDDLPAGDYVIRLPADNFRNIGAGDTVPGDPLRGYWNTGVILNSATGLASETTLPVDPDTDENLAKDAFNGTTLTSDENGRTVFSLPGVVDYVVADTVTLGASNEPLNDNDPATNPAATLEAPNDRSNRTVDFGFYRVEIGNIVYWDNNVNGTRDGGDAPINNVTVRLYDDNNHEIPVGPDGILGTTDDAAGGVVTGPNASHPAWANGEYHFSGLPEGNYTVRVTTPAGATSTIDTYDSLDGGATGDPDIAHIDDNDNGLGLGAGTILSNNVLTMDAGEFGPSASGTTTDNTLDFGFVNMVAIGNRIWIDDGAGTPANANNGRLDAGETGVNGVTVQLFSTGPDNVMGGGDDYQVGADTTTASIGANAGYYQFDNLYPGRYYVRIPASEFNAGGDLLGYFSSVGYGEPVLGVDDDDDQSDTIAPIDPAYGDENGIDGVTNLPVTRNTLTTDGIVTPVYNLMPNTEPTSDEHAGIYVGTLDDNNVNFTADFGFVRLVAIGNRVWIDDGFGGGTADDGIQQPGELGVDGVRVELYRQGQTAGADTPVAVVNATSGGGNYVFDNLVPGNYFVHIPNDNFGVVAVDTVPGDPLAGYISSTDSAAKDEVKDHLGVGGDENGIDAVSTATAPITAGVSSNVFILTAGLETNSDDETSYAGTLDDENVNFTADFGFAAKVALGNIVWRDNGAGGGTANNGIRDGTEAGIPNVDVYLYRSTQSAGDVPFRSTTTSAVAGQEGIYIFDNLQPGQYFVWIPATEFAAGQPLFNLLSSTGNGVADDDDDHLGAGGDENGIDNATPATNGISSPVYTLAVNTEPSPVTTDDDDTGYNGALDDDNVNLTADFGFTELVGIGNRIWFDTGAGAAYNNGILDGGETGVPDGVTVVLRRASDDTQVATTATVTVGGNAGYYQFDNLLPGSYYVQIPASMFDAVAPSPLAGYVSSLGYGPAGDDDDHLGAGGDENGMDTTNPLTAGIRTPAYNLQPNTEPSPVTTDDDDTGYTGVLDDDNVNFTADFGLTELVAIGNRIWYDNGGGTPANANNGRLDAGEAGVVNNVTVELYRQGVDPIGTPFRTTTTFNVGLDTGYYRFDNLNPGNYFVHIPASMFDGTAPSPLQGFHSSTGAGANETTDEPGDENGIDAADLAANGISTRVFTLQPNTEPSPATTDDNDAGYTGYLDDDNVNFTADFGFYNIVAIGNRIWLDTGAGVGTANDGIQNGTEPGINGVTVELWTDPNGDGNRSDGVQVGPTINTDDDSLGNPGYYVFDNLLAGNYVIHIPASNFAVGGLLEGYYSSQGNGANETDDQDVDENGVDQPNPESTGVTSTVYALSANTEPILSDSGDAPGVTFIYGGVLDDDDVNFTADFGFVQKYALGNRVWLDTDNDGLMDAGEVGVKDVQVRLYAADAGGNPTGSVVASDVTANGGYYLFDNIFPGEYVVVVTADNFTDSGAADTYKALAGYWSSRTTISAAGVPTENPATTPDPDDDNGTPADPTDDDVDLDDNGVLSTFAGFNGAAISKPVTIGPNGNTEPTDEDTAQKEGGVGDGSQPNGRSNLKVDFGFYKLSVGDLVFSDGNKDGTYLPAYDAPLSGVIVHLFSSGGTEIITGADGKLGTQDDGWGPDGAAGGGDDGAGGMPTDGGGLYKFDGLPAGDYIVRVDTPVGTSSTIDNGSAAMQDDNDDANENLNDNDNGDGTGNGVITSSLVTLTAVVDLVARPNNVVTDSDGTTHNPTMDFGFIPAFSLGNRVWYDTDNDGVIDDDGPGGNPDEVGIDGITLDVYEANASGAPIGAPVLPTAATANGGYYLFNPLPAGNYVVIVTAANFSGILEGYWSSGVTRADNGGINETNSPDPDNDADTNLDENGMHRASDGDVISKPVTLGPNPTEPTGELDLDTTLPAPSQGQPNNRANMTVDFGFYTTDLGNLVWEDVDNNGNTNGGLEAGIGDVDVELWSADGSTRIGTTTTNAGGIYGFSGLPQGNYTLLIPALEFNPFGPVAENDSAATNGGPVTTTVMDNDYLGAPPTTITASTNGTSGTVACTASDCTYTPTVNATDSYTYTITDSNGNTSTASVFVEYIAGAPLAVNDFDSTTAGTPVTTNLLANDALGTAPTTIVEWLMGGDGSSSTVNCTPTACTYTPASGFTGMEDYYYTIRDSAGQTSSATVIVTVGSATPALYAVGNRIWNDDGAGGGIPNDGRRNGGEAGIAGVVVQLWSDPNNDGNPADGAQVGVDSITDAGGYYEFDNVPAGNYVVVVPAVNFNAGNPLDLYSSSGSHIAVPAPEDPAPDVDTDTTDSDDNGELAGGDVRSGALTLGGAEPTGENQSNYSGSLADANVNFTVDFGFVLSALVRRDGKDGALASNGAVDAGVILRADGLSNAEIRMLSDYRRGPLFGPGSVGTLNNFMSSTGTSNPLPPIQPGPNEPAPDPDTNADNEDNGSVTNGILGRGARVQASPVTMRPGQGAGGPIGGAPNNTVTNAQGRTSNPTIDFGVFKSKTAPLIGIAKNLVSSTEISPGTYQVVYDILVRNMGVTDLNNVRVTENLRSTFTAPTRATFVSASAVGLTINPAYAGSGNLLTGADSLAAGASGTIRLVVNVVPYAAGPFQNSAVASGASPIGGATVTDRSQNGIDPDPDRDGNPTNNNVPTPIRFGPGLFDPPIGLKVFDDSGLPLLQWSMYWINSTNIAAVSARVSDPIPAGTTYVASGAPSGYPVPGGAPAGSTNIGVSCTSPSPATTTTRCYYEGPIGGSTGRIVWEGTLGPDFGHTTVDTAVNELVITFRVDVPTNVNAAYNVATIDTDLDGNGAFSANEIVVAESQAIWVRRGEDGGGGRSDAGWSKLLPATGFAPHVVTDLPEQPAEKAYFDPGSIRIEIPKLGIDTLVTGIPLAKDGTWDVTWLWNQTGWLQGTAYPTMAGNSVITGHVYLPNGEPGIFVDMYKLSYGDKVILHAYGQKYTYEVRDNKQVLPNDISILKREDKAWVTLLTCQGYNEASNTYASRVAVKAVLMTVETENTTSTPGTNSRGR